MKKLKERETWITLGIMGVAVAMWLRKEITPDVALGIIAGIGGTFNLARGAAKLGTVEREL